MADPDELAEHIRAVVDDAPPLPERVVQLIADAVGVIEDDNRAA
jgi:hypothetical protein